MLEAARDRRVAILARVVGAGLLLALVCTFFMGHYCQREYPHNTFLMWQADRFMDFFNINEYVLNWSPYYPPKLSTYPPLGLVFARLFAVGSDYRVLGTVGVRNTPGGLLRFSLLVGLFLAFYFRVIYQAVRTGDRGRDLKVSLLIGCNYPLLFLLDRGNYLMACFICLFGFVHCYRSRPVVANLCLVGAISLKLHPALFLLLPASDRRWRDCWVVVGSTLLLNLGALALFRGPMLDNIGQYIYNVFFFGGGYHDFVQDSAINLSFFNLLRVPFGLWMPELGRNLKVPKLALALAVLAGLLWLLRSRAPYWKKVFALCIAEMGLQTYSPDYNLVLLVIPLLLYFNEAGTFGRGDRVVLGCVGLLFVPKAYGVLARRLDYPFQVITPQAILNPLLLLVLFAWVVLSTEGQEPREGALARQFRRFLRGRRASVEAKVT